MAQELDSSYYASLLVSPPPPGVTPNFQHPQSRTIEAYVGMGICIGITAVLMFLRIYIKLAGMTHAWGWDDCESFKMDTCPHANGSRGLPDGICTLLLSLTISALTVVILGVHHRSQCRIFCS